MPKIFEYLGIIIRFFSNEHNPIHIHAYYGDAVIKVVFLLENGDIAKINYEEVKGDFPPAQLKKLKKFIFKYKKIIVQRWIEYFVWNTKIKCEKITKEIK